MKTLLVASTGTLLVLAAGCAGSGRRTEDSAAETKKPAREARAGTPLAAAPELADVTRRSGIRFRHDWGGGKLDSVLKTAGSGVGLGDYDGDGWLDVFFPQGAVLNADGTLSQGSQPRPALYRNDRDWTFSDVTRPAGLDRPAYATGCAFADYDADGDLDLYVTCYGPNILYRNRGDGSFEDATGQAGVGAKEWSTSAAFADLDNDGDLDLYVCNYLEFRPDMVGVHSSALSKREGFHFFPGPRDYDGVTDVLYRNNGDGTFRDVSREAGLSPKGKGLGVVICDLDGDGFEDVYVANDKTPNYLYRNRRDGTFEEIALQAGVAVSSDGEATAGMGVDAGDFDGDGRLDLFVTNMVFEYNALYRNRGDWNFEDVTHAAGLAGDSYRYVGWGTLFLDLNNDTLQDLVVINGHVMDYVDSMSQSMSYRQDPFFYLNQGDGTFRRVNRECGPDACRKLVGRGLASGDLDNDGDLDLVVTVTNDFPVVLENRAGKAAHFVALDVRGPGKTRSAIGATVRLTVGGRVQVQEVRPQRSYLSSSDPRVFFGLGAAKAAERLEITWPGGAKRSFRNVPADRFIVVYPDAKPRLAAASR